MSRRMHHSKSTMLRAVHPTQGFVGNAVSDQHAWVVGGGTMVLMSLGIWHWQRQISPVLAKVGSLPYANPARYPTRTLPLVVPRGDPPLSLIPTTASANTVRTDNCPQPRKLDNRSHALTPIQLTFLIPLRFGSS
jgi:hypothetical protein